jgi:penicillin-insensitive murein endopeptidase
VVLLVLLLSAEANATDLERVFPRLADEPAGGSRSIGDTSSGFLVGARELVEGDALGILPATRARGLVFGSDELVELIEGAAAAVRASGGGKLWVGNLGRQGGGDIGWSVSHNSGRDADLALCYRDAAGAAVEPTWLEPIRASGRSARHGWRFDAPRCWVAVKALLGHPRTQVQYLFVASWLERMLLAHARAIGEPMALRGRAAAVLVQPYRAAAHDDHIHLRLYCSERDVQAGCVNSGPMRAGTRRFTAARAERIAAARAQLAAPGCEERRAAIDRLALLAARGEAGAIARRLGDACAEVRWSAAAALGFVGRRSQTRALSARLEVEAEPIVRAELVAARERLRAPPPPKGTARGAGAAFLMRSAQISATLRSVGVADGAM